MRKNYCADFDPSAVELGVTRADKLEAKRAQRTQSKRTVRNEVDAYYAEAL